MQESDAELIRRYRSGHADGLEVLVTRYRRPLYGFIIKMTEGRDDADEIFQEVWFRAIRKIDGYRHRNFMGWLVRIAHNLIIDRARRRKPEASLDQETEEGRTMAETIPAAGHDPSRTSAAGELGARIASAVARLPDAQKEVFLMRTQADLPFKEIARIQETSINTALARMQYALAKLRALLKTDYEALKASA